LSALALGLSAYLGWHYLRSGLVIGCGSGSACEEVLNSRWSAIGGVVPVSGLAAGLYLAMLLASFSIGPGTEFPVRRLAWRAMLVLVGAAVGSAVWFFIVQKWIVKSFCPYCMATHITGVILAALVIWRAPRESDQNSTTAAKSASASAPRRVAGWIPAIGFASIGLAFAAILVVCQVRFAPPAVYRGGESSNSVPVIDAHAAPLVGSPDAPYIIDLLFDYKCPHCQQLHFMLDEVVRRYGGKLAFALCPAPLNTECNPYISRDVDRFKDSCELAKIGLTVWLARREAFPAFDGWMFSLESGDRWQPRSLDAARAKAMELVSEAKFNAARTNAWIDEYLQSSVRLYGNAGSNAIPKLVFGSRWVTPQVNDADDLVLILHDSLGVPMP